MPALYVDANPRMIAYALDFGGSGHQHLPLGLSSIEAEYLAISYGLNEYFLKWNRELDARQSDIDIEKMQRTNKVEFADIASPADRTKRPLPPAVVVRSDNEVVVKQLNQEYHIGDDRLRKLAQQVWQQCQNVDVKFEWIPRSENKARRRLR